MNLIKSVMKQKENELYSKQGCRVFAVKVSNSKTLAILIDNVNSKLQPSGFLNYFHFHVPKASKRTIRVGPNNILVKKWSEEYLYWKKEEECLIDGEDFSEKEFDKNGGKKDCAILFNDDLAFAYPDKLSAISERYPSIKVYHQSYFSQLLKNKKLIK